MNLLTHEADGAGVGATAVFVLAGASGSHTVACGVTSSGGILQGQAISFTGVNQTTPNRTAIVAQGTADPISVTVSNAQSGDMVVDSVFTYHSGGSGISAGGSQNQRFEQTMTTSQYIGSSTEAASGSTTMTWTGALYWGSVGVALEAAGGTVTNPSYSPAAGSYSNTQTVTITAQAGATICYNTCNTNSCTPTTPAASTPGTCSNGTTLASGGTVSVSGLETISSLGTESGYTNSSVVTATYTFANSNPTYGLGAGLYTLSLPKTSSITSSSTGATICWTACYTASCTPSTPTSSPVGTCSTGTTLTNGSSVTLKAGYNNLLAIATRTGYSDSSSVAGGQYQVSPIASALGPLSIANGSTGGAYKLNGIAVGAGTGNIGSIDGIAFAGVKADLFIDMEGLSNGVTPNTTTLGTSTHPTNGGSLGSWAGSTMTPYTGQTSKQLGLMITPFNIAGVQYSGAGSMGLQFATQVGGAQSMGFLLNSSYNTASMGYWLSWSVPDNDTLGNAYSMNEIGESPPNDYVDALLLPTGTAMCIAYEVQGEGDNGCIQVSNSTSPTSPATGHTLYWVTQSYVMNGTHKLAVYRCTAFSGSNCTAVTQATGSPITVADHGGSYQLNIIAVGINGAEAETAGYNIWIDDVVVNLSGTFPLGPCLSTGTGGCQ